MTRPGDRNVLAISKEELIQRLKKVRGIQDENVLDAIRQVPREEFVPEDLIKYAYEDTALPIGEGPVITQPYLVIGEEGWSAGEQEQNLESGHER